MERRRRRLPAWTLALLMSGLWATARAKVYDRCELALELHERFKFPKRDLDKWLCLAYWESRFDTRAYHKGKYDGSGDHGIFQINDKHWCQPHQGLSENVCRMPLLRDDNLYDDIECVNKIFRRHGFHAWMMFSHKCSGNTLEFFNGCDFRIRRGDMTAAPSGLSITIEPPPIFEKLSQLTKGIYESGSHGPPTTSSSGPTRRAPERMGSREPDRWTAKPSAHKARPPRPRAPQKLQSPHRENREPVPIVFQRRTTNTACILLRRRPPLPMHQLQSPNPPPPRRTAVKYRPPQPPHVQVLHKLEPQPQPRPHPRPQPQRPQPQRPLLQRPQPLIPQLQRPLPQRPPLLPGPSIGPGGPAVFQDIQTPMAQESISHVFAIPPMGPSGMPLPHIPLQPQLVALPGTSHGMFELRRGPPPLPVPVHVPPPPAQLVVYKRTKTRRLPGGIRLRPFIQYARSSRHSKGKAKRRPPSF
ncbi:hypothetical protein IscW_ISCW018431 [Ixodes scapularis]|uniref:lysozyme n=1 Tax=Ixodes scapularis TaxID=6945 RepID=B7PQG4_IXOSC|nr:hypothetical protein IscW_ISCW018431 [Ixodes scapularis]|eukprot:XP_002436006.1 hypothetical protein IscW_ISCW018431 [Ixodes scapularis]